MDEFALIADIVAGLGEHAGGPQIELGPGDDAALAAPPSQLGADAVAVASIDTLLPDVHFPAAAPADLVGYRAIMVAASDLAAMAALPGYMLVSLTLPQADQAWVKALTQGMAQAAGELALPLCGGNLTRGPLNIAVSVHGWVRRGQAVTRSGAEPGDILQVSGPLGGAAACVRQKAFAVQGTLNDLQRAYYRPRARLDLREVIAGAHAAIDISDGLLQDAVHLLAASNCGAEVKTPQLPVAEGAELNDALHGGDDYELLVAHPSVLPGFAKVGVLTAGQGLKLDGKPIRSEGYDHFRA